MRIMLAPLITTIPHSVFSLSSVVWSSTMFMNWSKPRNTPVTWRLAFSVTLSFLSMNFLSSGA
eukprot:CAMPEP_0198462922 /NCGR_PEP_ID=MMETSP1456-20131121/1334_1 /TAXON_ID=1461544 ORGANISM="Unidentified sp., Strain RCC1871" /NCGR_SAMPLE_ID=MMETSP1456 /ASSEMBLY_ACC=CAM_ASM_001119 /LENGTH=62 /DNA_ID=CAMNT_0044188241 /DNA_START=58 /DNA_END=246 /DNA_ORIENTATION=+